MARYRHVASQKRLDTNFSVPFPAWTIGWQFRAGIGESVKVVGVLPYKAGALGDMRS